MEQSNVIGEMKPEELQDTAAGFLMCAIANAGNSLANLDFALKGFGLISTVDTELGEETIVLTDLFGPEFISSLLHTRKLLETVYYDRLVPNVPGYEQYINDLNAERGND